MPFEESMNGLQPGDKVVRLDNGVESAVSRPGKVYTFVREAGMTGALFHVAEFGPAAMKMNFRRYDEKVEGKSLSNFLRKYG